MCISIYIYIQTCISLLHIYNIIPISAKLSGLVRWIRSIQVDPVVRIFSGGRFFFFFEERRFYFWVFMGDNEHPKIPQILFFFEIEKLRIFLGGNIKF